MILITGTSDVNFAKGVASYIDTELADVQIGKFNNGETKLVINTSLRGEHVYIFLSPTQDINDKLMEVILIMGASQLASVTQITLVVPCFPYARQDKKMASRDPISAKTIIRMFEAVGVKRIITVDLHNEALQGFSDYPIDNLSSTPIYVEHIKKNYLSKDSNYTVVSPDAGGTKRAEKMCSQLGLECNVCHKKRGSPGEISEIKLLGDVNGKNCIIFDDIIDTGGTLIKAVDVLKKHGAQDVIIYITHGVLSNDAVDKIEMSQITKLYITDSVNVKDKIKDSTKIELLSIQKLIATAIVRHYHNKSMSPLFSTTGNDLDKMLDEGKTMLNVSKQIKELRTNGKFLDEIKKYREIMK